MRLTQPHERICKICENAFYGKCNACYCSNACRLVERRLSVQKWRQSTKGQKAYKEYYSRPDVKEKRREFHRRYMSDQQNRERINRQKRERRSTPEEKARIVTYRKERWGLPEVKAYYRQKAMEYRRDPIRGEAYREIRRQRWANRSQEERDRHNAYQRKRWAAMTAALEIIKSLKQESDNA